MKQRNLFLYGWCHQPDSTLVVVSGIKHIFITSYSFAQNRVDPSTGCHAQNNKDYHVTLPHVIIFKMMMEVKSEWSLSHKLQSLETKHLSKICLTRERSPRTWWWALLRLLINFGRIGAPRCSKTRRASFWRRRKSITEVKVLFDRLHGANRGGEYSPEVEYSLFRIKCSWSIFKVGTVKIMPTSKMIVENSRGLYSINSHQATDKSLWHDDFELWMNVVDFVGLCKLLNASDCFPFEAQDVNIRSKRPIG